MNLYKFIKQDCIRQRFIESCQNINSIEEAEKIANNIFDLNTNNIIFETSMIKNRFFQRLKLQYPEVQIINCNAHKDRLYEDLSNIKPNRFTIFDNIDKCEDLEKIKEYRGIYIY